MNIANLDFKTLPITPGCYLYKDIDGKIIYVGKAVNLRNRITSYFKPGRELDAKTRIMLKHAVTIDLIEVDSEVEALILETNLIKEYRPKYNVRMKDDKNYIWVMFDDKKPFPRPEIVREKKIKSATYFGPYPDTFPAKQVLKKLRFLFPYCNTNFTFKRIDNTTEKAQYIGAEKRPCLDTFIGLCSGVCAGRISQKAHRQNITNIKKYFRGQKSEIKKQLKVKMDTAAKLKDFELAAKYRDQLRNLEYITQRVRLKDEVDETAARKAKLSFNLRAQEELKQRLKLDSISRKTMNFRIECYDISNIQGKNAVGSMVVFQGGTALKSDYRKFKIKTKETPDDFFMMKEVFTRRFSKLASKGEGTKDKAKIKAESKADKSFSAMPDLIIVDGGKGQLHSAWTILQELGLDSQIPIIGLAKREEEIFQINHMNVNSQITQVGQASFTIDSSKFETENFRKIILAKRSEALYLIQRVRDEAHRFAIGYHRRLRSKSAAHSLLDDVPGIGYLTKKKLIQAFGSIENIKKASEAELQTVIRNKRTVKAIKKLL